MIYRELMGRLRSNIFSVFTVSGMVFTTWTWVFDNDCVASAILTIIYHLVLEQVICPFRFETKLLMSQFYRKFTYQYYLPMKMANGYITLWISHHIVGYITLSIRGRGPVSGFRIWHSWILGLGFRCYRDHLYNMFFLVSGYKR